MNKKGFTLVELIVVILIVGVLSLLATTAVVTHINKTKKEAAFNNAKSYVEAINDYNFISEGEGLITSGNTSTITPILKDSFEGQRPDSGTVTIDSVTHKVSGAQLVFGSYTVTYNGSNYVIVKN